MERSMRLKKLKGRNFILSAGELLAVPTDNIFSYMDKLYEFSQKSAEQLILKEIVPKFQLMHRSSKIRTACALLVLGPLRSGNPNLSICRKLSTSVTNFIRGKFKSGKNYFESKGGRGRGKVGSCKHPASVRHYFVGPS